MHIAQQALHPHSCRQGSISVCFVPTDAVGATGTAEHGWRESQGQRAGRALAAGIIVQHPACPAIVPYRSASTHPREGRA